MCGDLQCGRTMDQGSSMSMVSQTIAAKPPGRRRSSNQGNRTAILRLCALALIAFSAFQTTIQANGLLVPTERGLPPLGLVYQRVNVTIKDQAAVTRVEQEFANPTSRPLEAWYIFPLPSGAGVKDFAMWVNGKRLSGEMLDASKARQVYEDIVRRSRDPGLLEQLGNNLWRVRIFPVPAHGRQKVEITYSEIVPRDSELAQYTFPLKTGSQSVRTQDDFTVRVEIESSAGLKSVYSPSHPVGVSKQNDNKAIVGYEGRQVALDSDFRLYWTTSDKDIGLSVLPYRESPGDAGYFLMLLSPKFELNANTKQPRDIVFVVDTSGSMTGEKMRQAKAALESCLKSLPAEDRFGIIQFATTTNSFDSTLQSAGSPAREKAIEWTRKLEAVGGTAIDEALQTALAMRPTDARNFTIVFMTDGEPTVGETDPKKILQNVENRNQAGTRIFVFGVGDEVNAALLDQLAEKTRATSVYVRPNEDLEQKVSSFFAKVSRPVLTELSLTVKNPGIKLLEMFPPKLPDLFHGGQLVVLGRYQGDGATAFTLEGNLGSERKQFVFEAKLPNERRDVDFVPTLWARRKVGYLLDQIRQNGERKELIDEVVQLAKRFGIATPYTSFLVNPDERVDMRPIGGMRLGGDPGPPAGSSRMLRRREMSARGGLGGGGGGLGGGGRAPVAPGDRSGGGDERPTVEAALGAPASTRFEGRKEISGKKAVDYAIVLDKLKSSQSAERTATKTVAGKSFVSIQGIWIDTAVKPGATPIKIKYLSDAYFALVGHDAKIRSVLALGENVVWQSPSGKTIAIAPEGKESLTEAELADLLGK